MIRVNGGEPQHGLVPTNTNEGYGNRIVDLLFTGLFDYDDAGRLRPAMAERVELADDRTSYVIILEDGWTFTDGTAVTAQNYVDAWNYGALSTNGQAQSHFFAPIEGYEDVSSENPRTQTMSGLTVVDDRTFTVRLAEPNIDFLQCLGFTPFKPLPKVFFETDPRKFGKSPVGNGPYLLAGYTEQGFRAQIDVVANPGYHGRAKPGNEGISFVIYHDLEIAYRDLLAGELDVLDTIPDTALATYRRRLGDRAIDQPAAMNKTLSIPFHLPHFSGEEGRLRRAAISRAIDRRAIVDDVFHGTKQPAREFTARTLPGFDPDLPGSEVLDFDAAAARDLWAQADAISPWEGEFGISYNVDGGHETWIGMLAGQLHAVLGIQVTERQLPTFRDIRNSIAAGTMQTAFRTGWRGDYPSMIEFLESLFVKGAGANDVGYHSPEFEAVLADAKRAPDLATAHRLTNEAQVVLLRDLPVIPLWDHINAAGRGVGVSVNFRWNGLPDYVGATKALDQGAGR